jgi:hypothetical protein
MDAHEGEEGLWFGDDESHTKARSKRGRQVGVVVASVVCIAAISVPVAFALSSSGRPHLPPQATKNANQGHSTVGQAQAKRAVLSALSATTSSGSFNVTYQFDPLTAPTVATTTTTAVCHAVPSPPGLQGVGVAPGGPLVSGGVTELCSGSGSGSAMSNSTITGQGTIDTDPFAMVATSNVPSLGMITLRDNGTQVWEMGGGNYGLSPGSGAGAPGSSLSGFAGSVEGTLGQRQGALAMGGLASPTGYLDLAQSMISAAGEVGTGTVDGVAVTIYQVSIAPGASVPGVNAEQAKTITAADAVLQAQGYTGTTELVSIDASGFIRQTRSVAHFSDGSTDASEATFSDFGCAGTVLMPGQSGAAAPPAGCISPDTGLAPTTTTVPSTAPPSTSTTTAASSTTTTTLPTSATLPPTTSTTTISAPSSVTTTTS